MTPSNSVKSFTFFFFLHIYQRFATTWPNKEAQDNSSNVSLSWNLFSLLTFVSDWSFPYPHCLLNVQCDTVKVSWKCDICYASQCFTSQGQCSLQQWVCLYLKPCWRPEALSHHLNINIDIYIYNIDIKAQVCTSTFVKTHKPPAEMMASAHRTTSSSYSPLFTTFTSVPLLLITHKSSQSSPFWKKDMPYSSLLKLVEVSPVSAAVQCTLHVKEPRKTTANTQKKKKILSMQGTCFTEGIRTIRRRAGSAKLYVVLCHFLISGCSFFSFHILSVFAATVLAITFFLLLCIVFI